MVNLFCDAAVTKSTIMLQESPLSDGDEYKTKHLSISNRIKAFLDGIKVYYF
jgi:hypothetical protein